MDFTNEQFSDVFYPRLSSNKMSKMAQTSKTINRVVMPHQMDYLQKRQRDTFQELQDNINILHNDHGGPTYIKGFEPPTKAVESRSADPIKANMKLAERHPHHNVDDYDLFTLPEYGEKDLYQKGVYQDRLRQLGTTEVMRRLSNKMGMEYVPGIYDAMPPPVVAVIPDYPDSDEEQRAALERIAT